MSAAVAAILEGMPEARDLRMHEHDGRCVITARTVVLFDYAAGDVVMRNIALAALRQLGSGAGRSPRCWACRRRTSRRWRARRGGTGQRRWPCRAAVARPGR